MKIKRKTVLFRTTKDVSQREISLKRWKVQPGSIGLKIKFRFPPRAQKMSLQNENVAYKINRMAKIYFETKNKAV